MLTAEILLPVALNQTFTYVFDPQVIEQSLGNSGTVCEDYSSLIGRRVLVEFGASGTIVGLIVSITYSEDADPDYKIKPIIKILDTFSLVNDQWWQLMRFAARYYAEPLGKALKNAFPRRLRDSQPLTIPHVTHYTLTPKGQRALREDSLPKNAHKQRRILHTLESESSCMLRQLQCSNNDINTLVTKEFVTSSHSSPYTETQPIHQAPHTLSDEQQALIKALAQTTESYAAHLINGVTGSGKTEVYIALIEQALSDRGQVLLLVPEIGLTPQMLARFQERFGRRVATYHSGMTDIQRRDVFIAASCGDAPIIIGTRSAIFVPFSNLRLILIDEEHDSSYKQQEGFLYHARDLAVFRARGQGINVVMGSATPSLESLHNVDTGKFQMHYLTQRATQVTMPEISIVDRRGHPKEQVLADTVIQQMRATLQRGEQALLFLNRRGFSPVMGCGNCDWRSECPACSVFQTAHVAMRQLCCHHCGHTEKLPIYCPKCGDSDVYFVGSGTEKLESQLLQQFPHHSVLRLDRDQQTTAKQLDKALERIHSGEIDIILGTQLIVKGHHFPRVTMVCIVDADGALFSSNFRAEEHLYQQLIQVAGRAGRESQGRVFVQSNIPDHPVYQALLKNDYNHYAHILMQQRKDFALPPFAASATIKASAREQETVLNYLRAIKTTLKEHDDKVTVLGPVPLAIAKLKHRFQANISISATDKRHLQQALPLIEQIIKHFDRTNRYHTIIDVDAI